MPIDDREKTIYIKAWQDPKGILSLLKCNPQEQLYGPASSYFDAIRKPESLGSDSIIYTRQNLSRAVEMRYKELEEKIGTIKTDLEAKYTHR